MTRVLITSALPYINGVKHLGNLVGSMLPADIYARFQRARGRDVLFICATDEHGTPAELAALEAGQSVADYCREQHAIQKDLGKRFGLDWDYFGRSSSPQNHKLTQDFARALWKNGHLEVRTTRQVYSKAEGRFLPDRYVIRIFPHCGYERARGDQCENCTRVLDPTDLIKPRSALSGSAEIEIRESKHLFLKQSAFAGRLREWIESKKGEWPTLVTSIAFKWLDEGLHDRGITRDLAWGVKVPDDIADGQLKGKVFYVWFDAPIEYIGATKEWADANGKGDEWRRWWYDAKDVRYVQFMAKDNVPFHTVGFPVTIMGSGEPWKLVDTIKGFNWLTYYGGKFSTSGKRGIFMDAALDLLPADYWRYYLIANAPESADSSFTWEHFAAVVNKDLADVLGNFVNRVTKFASSRFGDKVPEGGTWETSEKHLVDSLTKELITLTVQLEPELRDASEKKDIRFRHTVASLRLAWTHANQYLTVAAPWTTIKQDRDKAAVAVRIALNLIYLIAEISEPFIPETSKKLFNALGRKGEGWPNLIFRLPVQKETMAENQKRVRVLLERLKPGDPYSVPDILFAKIEDDKIIEWKTRFGGVE